MRDPPPARAGRDGLRAGRPARGREDVVAREAQRFAAVAFCDWASYRSAMPAAVVNIALPTVPLPMPCE